jgi:ATP-dependent RNA helicase DeaD
MLGRLGLKYRFEPIPTADEIRRAGDARWLEELTADDPPDGEAADERTLALARRIAECGNVERTLARLLGQVGHTGPTEPRNVRPVDFDMNRGRRAPTTLRPPPAPRHVREWAAFHVTWGEEHGADPRRLLALLCRRGGIRGSDVGAIRVSRTFSVVEVSADVASSFATKTSRPDPREPRITVRPAHTGAPTDRGTPARGQQREGDKAVRGPRGKGKPEGPSRLRSNGKPKRPQR